MDGLISSCFTFASLNASQLYEIIQLREQIFVVEQNCPYLDCDGKDIDAWHYCLYDNNQLIAYARIIQNSSANNWQIGRVVVREEHRLLGLGKILMRNTIAYIAENLHAMKRDLIIEISAQEHLQKFYETFGFVSEGSVYLEDNIPHIKMVFRNPKS